MPYKKSYQKRRKYRRYRKMSGKGLALKALRQVKYIKKQVEHKYINAFSTASVDFNGVLVELNGMAIGSTDQTRIGNKIFNTNVTLNIYINSVDNLNNCVVSYIVFWDPENAVELPSDFLATTGSLFAPISEKHHNNRFSTKTLLWKTIALPSLGSQVKVRKHRIKINKPTQFSGAGSGDIEKGFLKLLLISNQTALNNPAFVFRTTLHYTDL